MQGHCKPLGMEPSYLRQESTRLQRPSILPSRREGHAKPLVARPPVPDRQAHTFCLPYPRVEALSAGHERGGRGLRTTG